jgi:hypothetical protein
MAELVKYRVWYNGSRRVLEARGAGSIPATLIRGGSTVGVLVCEKD